MCRHTWSGVQSGQESGYSCPVGGGRSSRTLEGDVVKREAVRVGGGRVVSLNCSPCRKLYLGAGYRPLIGHSGDQCGPGVLFQ